MALVRVDHRGRSLREVDAPWYGMSALVLRPRAREVLAPLIEKFGELLPLSDCGNVELFQPTALVNGLDMEASELACFADGRIMHIRKHVFRPERIAGLPVFKLANDRRGPMYFDQRFVDRWRESGLTGLEFKQLWAVS